MAKTNLGYLNWSKNFFDWGGGPRGPPLCPARVANRQLIQLSLPDNIYNWVVDFLENHAHCTKYAGLVSAIAVMKASVIQGSAIGPESYAVTAADLHPLNDHNRIFKFADDTYLVVPGVATGTCHSEIEQLQAWAADNNL